MAAKAALSMTVRDSRITRAALAKHLGVDTGVARRMLDPRHGTSVGPINDALRVLGSEAGLELRE